MFSASSCLKIFISYLYRSYFNQRLVWLSLSRYKKTMFKATSFYKFFPINKKNLKSYQTKLKKQAQSLNLRGLILIGEEGINASLCGKEKSLEECKKQICQLFGKQFFWKDSYCKKWSFKRLSVRIKKEVINIGRTYLHLKKNNRHLSPKEWENKLKKKVQILDLRNSYEVKLGQFKGAKNLDIESFQEFPKKLGHLEIDKQKETLIYCTGGIRCEKATEIMKDKGFKTIYQLEGGILNYLKEYPDSQFEKECFVFDHRVALDQNLQASKRYSLCPHCGQPGDLNITCKHCEKPAMICKLCKGRFSYCETCSKNCAYHFKSGHKCRKKYKGRTLSLN